MPLNLIDGDVTIRGALKVTGGASLGTAAVGNDSFDVDDPLDAAKQEHQIHRTLAQVHGSNASAERRAVHVARGAGSVVAVRAGAVVAATGDSTVSVDVRKDGTTILSAPIVLDNANAAYAVESGSVSVDDYLADDVFEVVITVSAGTGTLPQGVFVDFLSREAAD